jgi:hypothetical protein
MASRTQPLVIGFVGSIGCGKTARSQYLASLFQTDLHATATSMRCEGYVALRFQNSALRGNDRGSVYSLDARRTPMATATNAMPYPMHRVPCEASQEVLMHLLQQANHDPRHGLFQAYFVQVPSPYDSTQTQIVCATCDLPITAHRSTPSVAAAPFSAAAHVGIPIQPAMPQQVSTTQMVGMTAVVDAFVAVEDETPVQMADYERLSIYLSETEPTMIMVLVVTFSLLIGLCCSFVSGSAKGFEYYANIWHACERKPGTAWTCYPINDITNDGGLGIIYWILQVLQTGLAVWTVVPLLLVVAVDRGNVYFRESSWWTIRIVLCTLLCIPSYGWFLLLINFALPFGDITFPLSTIATRGYIREAFVGGPSLYFLIFAGLGTTALIIVAGTHPAPTKLARWLRQQSPATEMDVVTGTAPTTTTPVSAADPAAHSPTGIIEAVPVQVEADEKARLRGLLIFLSAAVAFWCGILTNTVSMAYTDAGGYYSLTLSMWYSCVRSNVPRAFSVCIYNSDPHGQCGAWRDTMGAAQAFAILMSAAAFLAMFAGLLDHAHSRIRVRRFWQRILVGLSASQAIFALLTWPLLIHFVTGSLCGGKNSERPGFVWGSSAFLGLAVMLLGLLQVAVALCVHEKRHNCCATPQ